MTRGRAVRRRGATASALLLAALLTAPVAGCGSPAEPVAALSATTPPVSPSATPTPTPTSTRSSTPTPSSTPERTPRPTRSVVSVTDPEGDPARVVVETASGTVLVDADVRPQGLDADGVLSPPGGVVGWYDEPGWPRPGWPGAAILAGHVGTPETGPDVFRKLPRASPGDVVTVTFDSGEAVRFVVTRSAGLPKEQTPADDSIWDAGNPEPLLRLITCDPRTPLESGHYEGNWVLWADLA
ncbi:class F sortase [Phycicoccus flavus]|uniref:class F sortase n=1 Tax=Phycicoccus flavus TaxID=2502783 RepID=UPI000FEB6FC1|nr:class F sortase [Phycicoccus flavus]NHA69791.1 class F sortase [Phycicoccus flavus]